MGKEATCTCRWNDKVSTGKALLETDEILFRGDFRLVIPLKAIRSVAAHDGDLRIVSPEGKTTFSLGADAPKWEHRILHPPRRVDKLGVKPASRVSVVQLDDEQFLTELKEITDDVTTGKPAAKSDLIFYGAEVKPDLKKLNGLKKSMNAAGALWIIYPKGIKTITEADVRTAAHDAGLVDVKVARFSDRLTALKFVIPVAKRS